MASFMLQPPEPFNFDKPETWKFWIKRFERYRVASKLSEESEKHQINQLIYCLGSKADEVFPTFLLTEAQAAQFDTVKSKFDSYFDATKNVIFERAQFMRRVQQPNENVDDFITCLHSLVDRCDYGAIKDEMVRDRLVVGLKYQALSERLQMDSELTLKKAVDLARSSERIKKQQQVLRNDDRNLSVEAVRQESSKKPWRPTRSGSKPCNWCGNYTSHPRTKCPAKKARCMNCGKYGHLKKVCRSKQVYSLQEEQVDEEWSFLGGVNDKPTKLSKPMVNVTINGVSMKFRVDTGADVTVISSGDYANLREPELLHTDKVLSGPQNEHLKVVGKLLTKIEFGDKQTVQEVYVIDSLFQPLLGWPAIKALDVLSAVNSVKEMFPLVFSGLGKLKEPYEIKLKPDAKPFYLAAPRRVPIPLQQPVIAELKEMERTGVISRVTEPTEWCAGMVPVPKKNGKVRICVDFTALNRNVCRERYILPTVDESLAKLSEGKVFSKLDANSGFWQVPMGTESRHLTTFITPIGRFCFNRLPFGISSAPEHFQRRMSTILDSISGVLCNMDDILVYGENKTVHDRRLIRVLECLKEAGVTLNDQKCEFSKTSIKFLGHIVSDQGIEADPDKIDAIVNMSPPTDITSLRRFLGMINQLAKFLPNLAKITKPLRELLVKSNDWTWGPLQIESFTQLKSLVTSLPVLVHFDINRATVVSADASSYGIGSVLLQKLDGKLHPVAFASRALTPTEQRYAQIEKESLALTWACEKFRNYLIGTHFKIQTDHKPLLSLFGNKDLNDLSPRIQRFRMRMMWYMYDVEYVPGKLLSTADLLSRIPTTNISNTEKNFVSVVEAHVNLVINSLPATNDGLQNIRYELLVDPICSQVIEFSQNGWPSNKNLHYKFQPYRKVSDDLCYHRGLLMKGNRLVIPLSLQRDILERIHEGHQGIVKCRERAKTSVWWPGMSKDIELFIGKCDKCAEFRTNQTEPLIPSELPERPWQKVGTDLFFFKNNNYLLIVDYFSRWIEIAKLAGTISDDVISQLKSIFARNGIPEVVRSDCGPQFCSNLFSKFAETYGFQQSFSSPRFPQSNGEAERAVQTIKNLLKKSNDPYLAMLSYRSTPLQNGYSPAELFMGRKLLTTLPSLPNTLKPNWDFIENFRKIDSELKQNQKLCHDKRHRAFDLPKLSPHDFVYVNDRNIRKKGQILKSNNTPRSYVVKTDSDIITRNRKHLTAIPSQQNVSRERSMDTTSLSNERNEPSTFDSTKYTVTGMSCKIENYLKQ